ncbi:MAG: adenine phosphoribosyltransferase [Pseudomonadota bacterium]|nr:adenine phosphoribosyltransferase [Pseudomonadota bacterium]
MPTDSIIKSMIRTIPDHPKKGILFRDISTLIGNAKGLRYSIDKMKDRYSSYEFDIVAGIEARGFIIGSAFAYAMNKGFVPVRKKGKLPGDIVSHNYDLEYGSDTIEIQKDAIQKGQKVLLIDDLLATGGTALGAISLIEKLGAEIVEICFLVDLPELKGGEKLKKAGYKYHAFCEFEGH